MTSQVAGCDQNYDQLKEQFDLMEKKYRKFKNKYDKLAALHSHDSSDDDSEDYEPPAKKQKISESEDPLEILVPELVDEILKYLTPTELLAATEVSSSWKNFIQSKDSHAGLRAMDKIVANFDGDVLGNFKVETVDRSMTSGRRYKHLKTHFGVRVIGKYAFPFADYASSLETLKIIYECKDQELEVEPVNFQKLQKLVIVCSSTCACSIDGIMKFLEACSFPAVTHLSFNTYDSNEETTLDKLMPKFPELKVLDAKLKNITGFDEPDSFDEFLFVPYKTFEGQPKLEAISIDAFYENVLIGFKDTLTEICLGRANAIDLITLLESLTELQSLSIDHLEILRNDDEDNEEFPKHDKLEILNISEFESEELDQDGNNQFHRLLRALPALQSLYVGEGAEDLLRVLASMVSFKKLRIPNGLDDAMDIVAKIRDENILVNTSFEIVLGHTEEDFTDQFFNAKFN